MESQTVEVRPNDFVALLIARFLFALYEFDEILHSAGRKIIVEERHDTAGGGFDYSVEPRRIGEIRIVWGLTPHRGPEDQNRNRKDCQFGNMHKAIL